MGYNAIIAFAGCKLRGHIHNLQTTAKMLYIMNERRCIQNENFKALPGSYRIVDAGD